MVPRNSCFSLLSFVDTRSSVAQCNKQFAAFQVSFARPSSENIKGANLYVSGIPKTMCQSELETLFAPYGRIITSRILCDSITGI